MKPQRSVFVRRLPLRIAVIAIAFIWSLPTLGVFVSSFRDARDIVATGWWTALLQPFQANWTLANYEAVLSGLNMANAFINSLIVSIPATIIPITIAAFAAYAFAWMRFPLPGHPVPGRRGAARRAAPDGPHPGPGDATRPWASTRRFLGVWLAHTAFGLPLAIFLLYNFISQLPGDLFETASIDGATPLPDVHQGRPAALGAGPGGVRHLPVPVGLERPAGGARLPGATEERSVMTLELSRLVGGRGQQWHLLTAGAFVTMILPVLVFLALQRYFVRGILSGSVKG